MRTSSSDPPHPASPALKADLAVYADGACKGNPGPGGWGALMLRGEEIEFEILGGELDTTNNRMELTAVIEALKALPAGSTVTVHTDSEYVCKGFTEWLPGWKRRQWRTAGGQPVKNIDLWKLLEQLAGFHNVRWRWVRGHAGNRWNERADQLANSGVKMAGSWAH